MTKPTNALITSVAISSIVVVLWLFIAILGGW